MLTQNQTHSLELSTFSLAFAYRTWQLRCKRDEQTPPRVTALDGEFNIVSASSPILDNEFNYDMPIRERFCICAYADVCICVASVN